MLEEDEAANWPESINGCNINVHVQNAQGSSVEGTIRYSFYAPSQEVQGTNPETGTTYTADSYTYSSSGSYAYITLWYNGGSAYERYELEMESVNGGSYSMNSATSSASASSDGLFDFSCY